VRLKRGRSYSACEGGSIETRRTIQPKAIREGKTVRMQLLNERRRFRDGDVI